MATGVEAAREESPVRLQRDGVGDRSDLRCAGCGYGVCVTGEPPPCPMCRGAVWDPTPGRPFTALGAFMGLETRSRSDRPQ
jgi:hypothetical protein